MSEEEKMIVSDDSSSDSSSSDEEEKALEEKAEALERQVSDNKYLYDVHVELVKLYEQLGDLKSMRAAYERFSEYFPLTPTIWLTWIKCEIKLYTSSDKEFILSLFNKATEDYLSVDLWLEYVQFCIGNCEMEKTYSVLEQGLGTAGLDTNHGSLLWDALRELELAQLSLYAQKSTEWEQQVSKVYLAFKRQLSVPLLDMENIYEEWQKWLESLPEEHEINTKPVEWGYQQAVKLLEVYKPFEEKLLTKREGDEAFAAYKDYIKVVKDPATILCLYERAVADLSLNVELWKDYCSYALKLGEIAYKVSKRSLRNCPWSEDLWIMHLRILEHLDRPEAEVKQCLEQGLNAILPSYGLNLWLTYLEYVRRTSTASEYLHKVFTQAAEQLGEEGDPTCKVLRLQARIYARQGDMKKVQQTWSQIIRKPAHKAAANSWLEYIALERQYGEAQQIRTLYQRAASSCTDWPQCITEDWLMYERECGSLQNVMKCAEKCEEILRKYEHKALLEQTTSSTTNSRAPKRHLNEHINSSPDKRHKIEHIPKPRINVSDIDTEKSVFLSNMREDVDEDKLREFFPKATAVCVPSDRKGNSRCFAYVQFSTAEEVEQALARDREPIDGRPLYISKCLKDQTDRKTAFKYSTQGEGHKLFVRGLPKKYSKEDVENIFKPYGAVAVRLVTFKSGQSKGLAYVECSNETQAQEAIKATNDLNVDGHTISVAISAPPPKNANPGASSSDDFQVPIRHARSRLQIPLVPRSLQIKKSNGAASTSAEQPAKTNDDFRKMLLNK